MRWPFSRAVETQPLAAAVESPVTFTSNRPMARFSFDSMWTNWTAAVEGTSTLYERISKNDALKVPAVYRARNLIASTIGTLPLQATKDRRRISRLFVEQPDRAMVRSVMISQTVEDMMLYGQAWWRITEFDAQGFPRYAIRIDPMLVSCPGDTSAYQRPSYVPKGYVWIDGQLYPSGTILMNGEPVPDAEVIRFDSPNAPILVHAADSLRTYLRLEAAASLYAKYPRPLGMFVPKDGADPATEEVQAAMDTWSTARTENADAYVGAAVEYKTLQWDPAQMQLVESRRHAALEVARLTGLDPEDLGVSTTSRTYQNAVDRRIDRVNETLMPYMRSIEERLSMPDVTPRGVQIRFDLDDLLRANPVDRWTVYKTASEIGAMTVDEIREEEGLPPLPKPVSAPQVPQATPGPTMAQKAPEAVFSATFDEDPEETFTFDMNFSVDTEARTISGTVVPFGKVAKSKGRRFRFYPDALKFSDMSRVKLLLDHDNASAVGRMIDTVMTPEGQWAKYKVAAGVLGDKALSMASQGVMDGFSVGVDFEVQPELGSDGVYNVKNATWRETSLTAMPAFDDARVDSVSLSESSEEGLKFERKVDTSMTTATNDETMAAFAANVSALTEAVNGLAQAPQRETTPATPQGGARVSEPMVYRPGDMNCQFSLVRDAWDAHNTAGESRYEAKARLEKFQKQQTEFSATANATFALGDNDGSTVAHGAIVPPGYRPDMYISGLVKGRPLNDAMSRGIPQNGPASFIVPRYLGDANLVATNTELTGVNAGTINDHDYVTVAPVVRSGKFVVSRELMESANPAVDAIVMDRLVEAYRIATEQAVATAIQNVTDDDTGSGQSTEGAYVYTVTDNGTEGKDLVRKVRNVVSDFQFTRFDQPNRLIMSRDGFNTVAGAEDGLGRPLFAYMNPQNAYGDANPVRGALNFDGLSAIPSWALDTSKKDVYIFNSADIWVFETPVRQFRFEEVQGPHNIVLATWGYHAVSIYRPSGLHAIGYSAG